MRDCRPILLLEDDTVDAMAVKRALKDLHILNPLVHVTNGEEALVYLKDDSKEKPCVILLDLNMPKMNGIEFLKVAKAEEKLKRIPAVVLTTSKDDQDRLRTFKLSIAGFVVKPVDYIKFVEAMRIITLYWTLSEQPSNERESTNEKLQANTAGGR